MAGSSDDGQYTLLLHLCLLSGCYKNTAMEARITHHAALCVGDALRHNDVKIPAACVAEMRVGVEREEGAGEAAGKRLGF